MGCDIFYSGQQADANLQDACCEFLQTYFSNAPLVRIARDAVAEDSLMIRRTKKRYDDWLPLPGRPQVLFREYDHNKQELVYVEMASHLPYVGVVPWSMTDLKTHLEDEGSRLHFVFHVPSGELCSIQHREWFPSLIDWHRAVEESLGPVQLSSDELARVVCIATSGGYWRELGSSGPFELLFAIKAKYIPTLRVADDWNEFNRMLAARKTGILAQALLLLDANTLVDCLRGVVAPTSSVAYRQAEAFLLRSLDDDSPEVRAEAEKALAFLRASNS